MSATKELIVDIWDMLAEGETPQYISKVLNVPVTFVYEAMELDEDVDSESNTEVYSPFVTSNS